MDFIEEDDFVVYVKGILMQIQDHFPNASFMVFDFHEGENISQIVSLLSQYDMTIIDYAWDYEGCPVPKMEMIHHFLRSCESWLSLGKQNFLMMHCEEDGWLILAFMLAALAIYFKQYANEQRALEMMYKHAPSELLQLLSPLNPFPSQLRYLEYVSRSVVSEWPLLDRALTLNCVILRRIPQFDIEGGCRPIFRIYGQDPLFLFDRSIKVLYSTPKWSKSVQYYRQADCESVQIDIHCHVQGDVILECIHLDEDLEGEEMIFRIIFNTTFIRSNILILNRDEIDILWNAKDRFAKYFRAEVLFSPMETTSLSTEDLVKDEQKEGLPMTAFDMVKEIFSPSEWIDTHDNTIFHMLQQMTSIDDSKENLERKSNDNMLQMSAEDIYKVVDDHIELENSSMISTSLSLPTKIQICENDEKVPLANLPLPYELQSSYRSDQSIPPSRPTSVGIIEDNTFSGHPTSTVSHPTSPLLHPPQPPIPPPPRSIATLPQLPPTQSKLFESISIVKSLSIPLPPPPPPSSPLSTSLSLTRSNVKAYLPSSPLASSQSCAQPTPPSSSIDLVEQVEFPTTSSSLALKSHVSSFQESLSCMPQPPPVPSFPNITTNSVSSLPIENVDLSHNLNSINGNLIKPISNPPSHPPPFPPPASIGVKVIPSPPSAPPVPPSISSSSTMQSLPPPPPPNSVVNGLKNASLGGLTRTKAFRNPDSTQLLSKKVNLKPLHWVKVSRAMKGSIWAVAQEYGEASKAPEIDMSELESLFAAVVPNSDTSTGGQKIKHSSSFGGKSDKVHLIDLRRANNCEIMLTKVKIPLSDLMSSLLSLDDSVLDVDQVENLIKFCPTKEEMELLQGYSGSIESLGKCEQFFLELMKVPRVESKLRVFSFKSQFHTQVADLRNNLNIIVSSANEIRGSVKLRRIMQTILSLGNALNQGTPRDLSLNEFSRNYTASGPINLSKRVVIASCNLSNFLFNGSAIGFRLDSLLKLTDIRARNNKMTLMHYLCKMLSEKLPEVLDFDKDLVHLETASKVQLKVLAEEMQAICKGLEKVQHELKASENDGPISETFRKTLKEFLTTAESEVSSLTSLYSLVGSNGDALALYFGEDPARCPFEQVLSTLFNFSRTFDHAHKENCRLLELEKKKAQKEAESGKLKLSFKERSRELQLEPTTRNDQ